MPSPEFSIVKKPLTSYQELRQILSAALAESLLNASLAAGLSEDDALYDLFRFQGELFTAALDAQMKALDGALSARQAENKQLAALLADCQTSLKDSASQSSQQASQSAKQMQDLKTEFSKAIRDDRDARQEETEQLRKHNEQLLKRLPDVNRAAEIVRDINYAAVASAIGVALAAGSITTLLIEHFVLHL